MEEKYARLRSIKDRKKEELKEDKIRDYRRNKIRKRNKIEYFIIILITLKHNDIFKVKRNNKI